MKAVSKITFLLLLLLAQTPVNAQQKTATFSIATFALNPLDLDATLGEHQKYDLNGDLFAIIKVTSNNPNDDLSAYSFSFGQMESIVELKDGELKIYVQRNAKHVTITRNGYRPIKNHEFGFTIQPGKVYEMSLSVKAPTVYRQMVQFNVKPLGVNATILIKGAGDKDMQLFGTVDENGAVAKNLELGTYNYEIISDKYHKSEGRLVLKERNGNHTEEVVLRPNFSTITMNAAPEVDIYINDEKVGTEAWTGDLKAGTYSVECRRKNHKSVFETIRVEANDNRTVKLPMPAPITGVLSVISRPLGARITIDGKDYGVTPKNIDGLLIGSHKVEISKVDFKSETLTVDIREDETTECDVKLSDIAKITISSWPYGASLYIDGKYVGETPYTKEMPSGDYSVSLYKSRYKSIHETQHLSSSNSYVSFSLKRQYQQKFSGYIQASGQLGSLNEVGANVGCYLANFNIEAYYLFGLKKETLYDCQTAISGNIYSYPYEFSVISYGGKVGYGVILGTRCRLTPQVGMGILRVNVEEESTYMLEGESYVTNPFIASVGLRFEYAMFGYFGISLTPEYSFVINQKDGFKKISEVSSKIKGWGTGFNARLGLYFLID